jgi:nicotinamide riboside kinase
MARESDPVTTSLTVVLSGAESAGKTTLATALAAAMDVPWVAEYARTYLAGRPQYRAADLTAIARGQMAAERSLADRHRLIVADTDVLIVLQWSLVKYGRVDPALQVLIDAQITDDRPRLYLVPRPDMPWQPDPLRENPETRLLLHAKHIELLAGFGLDYLELSGTPAQRLAAACAAVRVRLPARS